MNYYSYQTGTIRKHIHIYMNYFDFKLIFAKQYIWKESTPVVTNQMFSTPSKISGINRHKISYPTYSVVQSFKFWKILTRSLMPGGEGEVHVMCLKLSLPKKITSPTPVIQSRMSFTLGNSLFFPYKTTTDKKLNTKNRLSPYNTRSC